MRTKNPLWLSLTAALALTAGTAGAQTIVTTAPTTYTGVVSEINPTANTIILKSEAAPAPVTYTYTPQTVFIDASGNTVSYEAIRNVPVTVEYNTTAGRTIVTRVTATRSTGPGMIERKTTTRTETEVR